MEPALFALDKRGWFHEDTIIVAEMSKTENLMLPEFLLPIDSRKYGAAQVLFLIRAAR